MQQGLAVERYDEADEALQQATMHQVVATTNADDAAARSALTRDAAADRARALYMSGGPVGLSTMLLSSTSISDALSRWKALEQVVGDVMLAKSAIKRLIEPAEVGALIAYLASDEASMITGSSYAIDGGWTAG